MGNIILSRSVFINIVTGWAFYAVYSHLQKPTQNVGVSMWEYTVYLFTPYNVPIYLIFPPASVTRIGLCRT